MQHALIIIIIIINLAANDISLEVVVDRRFVNCLY